MLNFIVCETGRSVEKLYCGASESSRGIRQPAKR